MPNGVQAVQSTHAAIDFMFEYPDIAKDWHKESNYLCQLSCENEYELKKIAYEAERKGIKITRFEEPDLGNSLTSICFEPNKESKKITKKFKLMFT